ncbi:MAG: hypothetical protein HYZ01_13210 [Ignavibacteriales bacterium]|nr:hypothetical protein [Ignavibacteriales bacterium]
MKLSETGNIVAEEWLKTPMIRPTITLDVWQVMPNHMHGIVVIHKSETAARSGQMPFVDWETAFKSTAVSVGTTRRVVPTGSNPVGEKRKPTLQPNSLGSIIGQFKSKCTKRIHDAGYSDFAWQGRFWDRIIRDADELQRIREYIIANPKRCDDRGK